MSNAPNEFKSFSRHYMYIKGSLNPLQRSSASRTARPLAFFAIHVHAAEIVEETIAMDATSPMKCDLQLADVFWNIGGQFRDVFQEIPQSAFAGAFLFTDPYHLMPRDLTPRRRQVLLLDERTPSRIWRMKSPVVEATSRTAIAPQPATPFIRRRSVSLRVG